MTGLISLIWPDRRREPPRERYITPRTTRPRTQTATSANMARITWMARHNPAEALPQSNQTSRKTLVHFDSHHHRWSCMFSVTEYQNKSTRMAYNNMQSQIKLHENQEAHHHSINTNGCGQYWIADTHISFPTIDVAVGTTNIASWVH